MANREKVEELKETEQTAQETEQDPWKVMKSIFLPRGFAGQQKFVMVAVNGRRYQVPRGKTVEVPLPLWERLMIMLEQENKAAEFMENIPNEAAPDAVVRRV